MRTLTIINTALLVMLIGAVVYVGIQLGNVKSKADATNCRLKDVASRKYVVNLKAGSNDSSFPSASENIGGASSLTGSIGVNGFPGRC
jgi:hypothetical protein